MVEGAEESQNLDKHREEREFLNTLLEKTKKMLNEEDMDEEASRMTERLAVLRIATKHIKIWTRQLEMKRKEMSWLG